MLFVTIGFLKDGADEKSRELGRELTGYLAQPVIDIRLAGMLLDERGGRAGAILFVEADDRAAAERFVKRSPLVEARLYAQTHLFEVELEVGKLGSRGD